MSSVKHIILNRSDGAYFVTAYAFCDEPTIRVLAMRFQNSGSPDEGRFAWLDGNLASWSSSTGLHRRANVSGHYDLMANVRVPEPKAPLARDRVYYKDYKFWVDRKRGPKMLRNLDDTEWVLGYVSGLFSRIEFMRTPDHHHATDTGDPLMAPKREKFQMRISEEEDDAFRKEADRVGLTTSEWLRQLGRRACGMPSVSETKERA